MKPLRTLSASEQIAGYLREELRLGTWSGTMPGEDRLVAKLGVGRDAVKTALKTLENEGLLEGQGPGRRRRIVLPSQLAPAALRVAFLLFDSSARGSDLIIELRHLLEEAGHVPFFPGKTLKELGMDTGRVARLVGETEADAWVVNAGSREVLAWFAEQDAPAIALGGRCAKLPIAGAGADKSAALAAATRRLIGLGHRRISLFCRRQHRLPQPSDVLSSSFLGELEAAGITTGEFNLPDWEESATGIGRILDSLFRHTPPTALIFDVPYLYSAAYQHLARRGLRVPEDVSLISCDDFPGMFWCQPPISHIRWDYQPVVRRIARWAETVSRGKKDLRQTFTKAEFVEGGTVGQAPAVR